MESLDVSNAFLQGFGFKMLEQVCKALGIQLPKVSREVFAVVPGNVWFLLAELGQEGCPTMGFNMWCLQLVKAMYGLNDGPLMWQLCLRYFYQYRCLARTSLFDENHFVWRSETEMWGEATAHVDDNNVAGPESFRLWLRELLESRFGKVGRQELPMVHVGLTYERYMSGFRLQQRSYALALKLIDITKERAKQADEKCTPEEKHSLHSGIGGLLFLCYTRPDIVVDTLHLQSKVSNPSVSDLLAHNKVVKKAWEFENRGLCFPRLKSPTCVVGYGDASGATKKSCYAIEGRIIVRKEDNLVWQEEGEFEGKLWNSRCHVLAHSGKKSKRVSQSTSHAESLSHLTMSFEAELVCMRLTEISAPRPLSLFKMMELDDEGKYDCYLDLATDCNDLFELATGQKGIPQDKSQRLVIAAIRQRRLMGKVRATVKITDRDMVANPLTKQITRQWVFDNLLATGELDFQDTIYYRKSRDIDPMGDCDMDSLWSKQLHAMD
jgi:hypothetical protein